MGRLTTTPDQRRALAQLADHDGPMPYRRLMDALGLPEELRAPFATRVAELERHGMVRAYSPERRRSQTVRPMLRPSAADIYAAHLEPTDAGRMEASGGAQLAMVDAPPPAPVQGALF